MEAGVVGITASPPLQGPTSPKVENPSLGSDSLGVLLNIFSPVVDQGSMS